MKQIAAAALIALSGATANAGSLTYEAPQNTNIEIEPSMNVGFTNWIIPVVIVAVLALALTSENNGGQEE